MSRFNRYPINKLDIKRPLVTVTSRSFSPKINEHNVAKQRSLFEKIGSLNFFVIWIGNLLILGVLVFLWMVWTGNEKHSLWRWLVQREYLQRTATLSSVVIRTIIGVQSGLCTSMIAAAILELSTGFNVFHSAKLSLERFNGGLPIDLLRKGIFRGRIWYLLILTIIIALTSIASHFISTALVSDLHLGFTFGDPIVEANAFSLNLTKSDLLAQYEADFTLNMPSVYPAFGEYSESPNSNIPGVDDTGSTVRAVLPISSAPDRQVMSNYSGPATVLNSHVVCVKPTIKELTYVSGGGEEQIDPPYITGSISIGSSLPPGLVYFPSVSNDGSDPLNYLNFTCAFAITTSKNNWPISMCVAGGYRLSPYSSTIDFNNLEGEGRISVGGLRASSLLHESLGSPLSYVLLNYTGQLRDSYGLQLTTEWTEISDPGSTWTTLQKGPSFVLKDNQTEAQNISDITSLSLNYCFTNFAAIDTDISVASPSNRTEPVLRTQNKKSLSLDTSSVLHQLGVDGSNSTLADRGILDLQYSPQWPTIFDNDTYETVANSTWKQALDGTFGFGNDHNVTAVRPNQNTWALCTNCGRSVNFITVNSLGISPALSSIFQTSIRATGSTAKALQAVFTVTNMMQYYSRLQQFDVEGTAATTFIEQHLQPTKHTGLLIVTIGVMIHFLIVTTITIIFLARTKFSFIGESWHTVAQLQSNNLVPLLDEANMLRDDEVEKWLEVNGRSKEESMLVGRGNYFEEREESGARVVKRR